MWSTSNTSLSASDQAAEESRLILGGRGPLGSKFEVYAYESSFKSDCFATSGRFSQPQSYHGH